MYQSQNVNDFNNPINDKQLIDVREKDEFKEGHIPYAQNFPLSELESLSQTLDSKETYYVVCQAGGRSARACDYLTNKGYNVINLEGGTASYQGELV